MQTGRLTQENHALLPAVVMIGARRIKQNTKTECMWFVNYTLTVTINHGSLRTALHRERIDHPRSVARNDELTTVS